MSASGCSAGAATIAGSATPQRAQSAADVRFQVPHSGQNTSYPPNSIETKSYGGQGPVRRNRSSGSRLASSATTSSKRRQRSRSTRNAALAAAASAADAAADGSSATLATA